MLEKGDRGISEEELLKIAGQLDEKIHAPLLWGRIENALRDEQRRTARHTHRAWLPITRVMLRYAAVVVITLAAGAAIWLSQRQPVAQSSSLLSAKALRKVERIERDYQEAISELTKLADARLQHVDVDLQLLYRDRLETIDAQITACKEALQRNPGNTHIRRYLLTALRDKKSTLVEILELGA